MGASGVIALREGIEAALIVSVVLAYLKQVGASDRSRVVWWGAGLAIVLSAALGTVIFVAGAEFEGTAEQVFEGLVTLAAVGVLTWMIFWMRRQGARIKSELQEKVDTALVSGGLALAGLAFFAVLREGIETALFLFAATKGTAVEGTAAAPAARSSVRSSGSRSPWSSSAAVPRRHPHEPPVLLPRDRVDPDRRCRGTVRLLAARAAGGGVAAHPRSHRVRSVREPAGRRGTWCDPSRSRRLQRRPHLARGRRVARLPRRGRWVVPPGTRPAGNEVSTRTRDFRDQREGTRRPTRPAEPVAGAGRVVTLFACPRHRR